MKKVITFCASLALVFVVSGGAKAAVDLGTIPVPGAASTTSAPTTAGFSEDFLFKVLTNAFVVQLSAILGPDINPATFGVKVFTSTSDGFAVAGTLLATALVTANPNVFETAPFLVPYPAGTTVAGVVDKGQIFVQATGDSTGSASTYSVQLTTSAVPLPPAAILFLSALAGLVGFSRIRRRKAVAT